MNDDEQFSASGVDALISKLQQQGVEQGQEEARRIIADAERRATWLLNQAKEQAEQLHRSAQAEAARYEAAGRQALEIAIRDALLRLKAELANLFHEELRRQVSSELSAGETLKKIILVLAGQMANELDQDKLSFALPDRVMDLEELRHNPEELEAGVLTTLTRSLSRELLEAGVTLVAGTHDAGIQVRLGEDEIELEFNDQTISNLLQMHLQPRFRAIMEGIVK